MNRLTNAERVRVIAALVEGNSIRATVRMTGIANNTVAKLLCDIGSTVAYTPDASIQVASLFTITNCILCDGGAELANNGTVRLDVMYSDVQDGCPGAGIIDGDFMRRPSDSLK